MKTIKITKTVFPQNGPVDFNEWAQWFWGIYKIELEKKKQIKSWDRNIYIPKRK